MSARVVGAVVVVVALVGPRPADAGGLARPSSISARGVGLGGAFVAIADDPTALHFNPAGIAFVDPQVMIGAELVVAPRAYTPIDAAGARGPTEEATAVVPVPSIGAITRFRYDEAASDFTLGVGVWNSFGGQVSYPVTGRPALDATRDVVLEVAPGFAYRVDDRLAFGASLRVGLGLFAVAATQMPVDSELSAAGLGVSYGAGVLVRPTPAIGIGLSWRAPLTVRTRGEGTLQFPGAPQVADVEHVQRWPQQLSVGLAARVRPGLRLAGQLDWSGWSRVDQITVEFPADPSLDQRYDVDWHDSWAARLGAELTASPSLVLRAGAYLDTSAVPDRTIERQYLDDDKLGVATGGSLSLGAWRIDGAVDVVLPGSRLVPDTRATVEPWRQEANRSPGLHEGSVYTLELALARRL